MDKHAFHGQHMPDGAEQQSDFAVDRRSGLDLGEFVAEYRRPRRPVILNDAAVAWPLYGQCTPDYFCSRFGERRLRVRGRDYSLAELIGLLQTSTLDQPGPYPCKFEVIRDFPELVDEVSPRPCYSLPDRQRNPLLPQKVFNHVNNLEIFFGGPGGKFPYLHYDVMRLHAWITQLHGDKEFTLYAPGQEHLLYVNPDIPWQSSIEDHHHPDFERYPLFRQAKSQKVVVHAGETLFLPCGWWHTARSLGMTISIAFDQLGGDNWGAFVGDVADERRRLGHRAKSVLLASYLRLIGPALSMAERFGVNQARDWGTR
jgi:hypothetical protein